MFTWKRILLAVGCLSLLLGTIPAFAEVMDKEPTLHMIWMGTIPWIPVVLIVSLIHPWAGVAAVVASVFCGGSFGILSEVFDSGVGPAIRQEAGMGYVLQVYGANASLLVSFAIGSAIWFFRRRLISKRAEQSL
ncbi:MAG TPA: hypothetical protein VGL77_05560 [Armatimonadota bacterium]